MTKGNVVLSSVISTLIFASSSTFAWEGGEPPGNGPTGGRMTGGGSIMCNSTHVTHGFELHCSVNGVIPQPNNLEINFGTGNNFHLVSLTESVCSDDPSIDELPPVAGFDTLTATGVGTFNQQAGYTIQFILTDAGEPGAGVDKASFVITSPGGATGDVLNCPLTVLDKGGNHQAHRATGRLLR